MGMKQKKIYFFSKKKFKMADSKKAHFSKSPILENFSWKSLRSVLGLVGLNDAKGIDVAQCIWPWGCLTKAQKQPKNAFSVLFGCFWAFVGQPHGHIRWATTMPFASFNPTNPRTDLRDFREKISRIGDFEKRPFWIFFFKIKKIKNCFIFMKISPNLYGRMNGSKFLGVRNITLYSVGSLFAGCASHTIFFLHSMRNLYLEFQFFHMEFEK